jgi:hypothetical protein
MQSKSSKKELECPKEKRKGFKDTVMYSWKSYDEGH